MAQESIAQKLARLKSEGTQLYDQADHLQYQEEEEESNPVLRLEERDPVAEFDWLLKMRAEERVPAFCFSRVSWSRLFVYPQGDRRFTLKAFQHFGHAGARATGLVAVRIVYPEEDLERQLEEMVRIAQEDAAPERQEEGLRSHWRQWLRENPVREADFLPRMGPAQSDGRMTCWNVQGYQPGTATCSDYDCYRAYLADCEGVCLAVRTGLIADLSELKDEEVEACWERREETAVLARGRLADRVDFAHKWTGWASFHRAFPAATGISMVSPVGYSGDGRRAFFTRFNRADPRILERANQAAANLDFLDYIWLEFREGAWAVTRCERARPCPRTEVVPWRSRPLAFPQEEDHPWPGPARRVCNTRMVFRPPLVSPAAGHLLVFHEETMQVGEQRIFYRDIVTIEVGDSVLVRLADSVLEMEFEEFEPETFLEALRWTRGGREVAVR